MDFKQIQELIRLVSKSELSELRIEQEGFKITLKKDGQHGETVQHTYVPMAAMQHQVAPVAPAYHAESTHAEAEAPVAESKSAPETAAGKTHEIKSPMIGTFYRAPGPDKDPFVKVGDIVKSGQVLCVIEAMKLFNEIEAEVSGKIIKVLAEDATPVEYDQPLFLIDQSEL